MDAGQLLGLSIFASYFLLILWLFFKIASSLRWDGERKGAGMFLVLAAASFAHTWYYMFKFMSWSFESYEHSLSAVRTPPENLSILHRIANWLVNTGLFEQAWAAVCFGESPWSWWWSQQLCLFTTGAWTVFLAVEGRRRKVRYIWAYMLLGQVVAISVASNLFYYTVATATAPTPSSPKSSAAIQPTRHAPLVLWLSVSLSLATVVYSPNTSDSTFLSNLLIMHALLVLPLIISPSLKNGWSIKLDTLYKVIAAASLVLHVKAGVTAVLFLPSGQRTPGAVVGALIDTLYYHPAQSSIGWDVVWTTMSAVVWNAYASGHGRLTRVVKDVVAVGAGSVGLAFAHSVDPSDARKKVQ